MLNRFAALSFSLAVALLAFPKPASAATGTITLSGGEIFNGDVTEIVPGNHLTLKLVTGELKVIAWSNLASYQFQGGLIISVGGNNAQPVATTATPQTQPQGFPPPNAQQTAPVAETYQQPEPQPVRHIFVPRVSLGARLSTQSWAGTLYNGDRCGDYRCSYTTSENFNSNDYITHGGAVEFDFGYHFNPFMRAYIGVELSALGNGSFNGPYANGDIPLGAAIFIGLNGTTNPRGLGLYYDIATGVRAVSVPGVNYGWDATTFTGWEILRGGLGVSYPLIVDRLTFDAYVWGSFGMFNKAQESNTDCSSYSDQNVCADINARIHTVFGLAVGSHFDL